MFWSKKKYNSRKEGGFTVKGVSTTRKTPGRVRQNPGKTRKKNEAQVARVAKDSLKLDLEERLVRVGLTL